MVTAEYKPPPCHGASNLLVTPSTVRLTIMPEISGMGLILQLVAPQLGNIVSEALAGLCSLTIPSRAQTSSTARVASGHWRLAGLRRTVAILVSARVAVSSLSTRADGCASASASRRRSYSEVDRCARSARVGCGESIGCRDRRSAEVSGSRDGDGPW